MKHRWPHAYRYQYRTYRPCARCGMVKTTHHEGQTFPWTTFVDRDGRELFYAGTPVCDGGENADTDKAEMATQTGRDSDTGYARSARTD